jgi:uncharacterized membrane protein YccC
VLRDVTALLNGADARPDFDGLERCRAASAAHLRDLAAAEGQAGQVVSSEAVAQSFYARAVAVAARTSAADALIATRRADPQTVAVQRRRWYGGREADAPAERRLTGLAGALGVAARHASLRSMWFLNSLRGTLALTAAVAVADLSNVQHGFWVVLGTMSVLRTSAAATGSTAARALGGTVIGFVLGAALLLAIGTAPAALWIALPVAVLIAAYAPGTAPFAVGQAAFTLVVVLLFNLLAPVGWKVGLLRIEDVAIGCAVSLAVGILFWPRGAGAVVGDDLADAFRRGSVYLRQAVDWALGVREEPPDAGVAAVTAGLRLDDALRGYLTEQGAKRVSKDDLWSLVMATMRLRLTANSLAGVPSHGAPADLLREVIGGYARELAGFYERVADRVGRPGDGRSGNGTGGSGRRPDRWRPDRWRRDGGRLREGGREAGSSAGDGPIGMPSVTGLDSVAEPRGGPAHRQARALWVREHLRHLGQHASAIPEPAAHVAQERRTPWWHL